MRRILPLALWPLLACSGAVAPRASAPSAQAGSPDAGPPAPDAGCDLLPELTPAQCDAVRALRLPDALPAARANAHADDQNAALLGFKVFYDARFSSNNQVRCASCHQPEQHFGDGLPVSNTLAKGTRNAPSLLNAARERWVFWDGRADTLWAQPVQALENPKEMGFTRLGVAHLLSTAYASLYAKAFGPLPDLSDASRFPAAGKPGDPAWEAMAAADQQVVNQVVANLGKGMEAYERKLAAGPAPLDRFLGGDPTALDATTRRGLAVFAQAGCTSCHGGPNLSDEGFHNLGLPAAAEPDLGRATGIPLLDADPFHSWGAFADPPVPDDSGPLQPQPADDGAFRTPSLRNVALSAPFGHDGSLSTLEDALDFHLRGGGGTDPQLKPVSLSTDDRAALLDFLRSMNGTYPLPPWNNWPDG
jgi:cytochrome c peroxidase